MAFSNDFEYCTQVSEDGMKWCPFYYLFYNGDWFQLSAYVGCPIDVGSSISEFRQASQQGQCECHVGIANYSRPLGEAVSTVEILPSCDCVVCPESEDPWGVAYTCSDPVFDICYTINCVGFCNGDLFTEAPTEAPTPTVVPITPTEGPTPSANVNASESTLPPLNSTEAPTPTVVPITPTEGPTPSANVNASESTLPPLNSTTNPEEPSTSGPTSPPSSTPADSACFCAGRSDSMILVVLLVTLSQMFR